MPSRTLQDITTAAQTAVAEDGASNSTTIPAPAGSAAAPAAGLKVDIAAAYADNPPPPYPSLSRRAGEQGEVHLSVLITAQGQVADVTIDRSSGYARLDRAAREAVTRWRFVLRGAAQPDQTVWVIVPVAFRLS